MILCCHCTLDIRRIPSLLNPAGGFALPQPHNGESTASFLIQVICKFNLVNRLGTTTTDSGSEIPDAFRIVRDQLNIRGSVALDVDYRVHCVCHIIDRAVRDSLEVIGPMLRQLRIVLKILCATKMLRSQYLQLRNKKKGASNGVVPVLDLETRWSSTYKM